MTLLPSNSNYETTPHVARHPVDELLPAGQLFVYGLQHVLAMYAGAVAVPLALMVVAYILAEIMPWPI